MCVVADEICRRLAAEPPSYAALHRELCALSRLAGPEPSLGVYPGRYGGLYSLRGCPFPDAAKEEMHGHLSGDRVEVYWNTGLAHHRVSPTFYWNVVPDWDSDVVEVRGFIVSGFGIVRKITVENNKYCVRSSTNLSTDDRIYQVTYYKSSQTVPMLVRRILEICEYSNTEQMAFPAGLPPKWDGVVDYATYLKYACKCLRVGQCPLNRAMMVLDEQQCREWFRNAEKYAYQHAVRSLYDFGPYMYC